MKKIYSIFITLCLSLLMCINLFANDVPAEKSSYFIPKHNQQKLLEYSQEFGNISEMKKRLESIVEQRTSEGKKVLDITPMYFIAEDSAEATRNMRANIIGNMTVSASNNSVYVDFSLAAADVITYMSADLEAWDITSFRHYDTISGYRTPFPTQYDQFDFYYTGYNSFITAGMDGYVNGIFGSGYFYAPTKSYHF